MCSLSLFMDDSKKVSVVIKNRGYCQHNFKVFIEAKKQRKSEKV